MSINGIIKEYFLDMAGIDPQLSWELDEHKWDVQNTPFGSGEVFGSYASSLWDETQDAWDNQVMFFGTGIQTDIYNVNDCIRAGLEAQGYYGNLNKMIREFATDTIAGVSSLDFDDLKSVWDQVPQTWNGIGITDGVWSEVGIPWELEDDILMGDVSDVAPLSINTAWKFLVNRMVGDLGESIGSVTPQALRGYAWSALQTILAWEEVSPFWESLHSTWDEETENGMAYTWDSEPRVWDYIG